MKHDMRAFYDDPAERRKWGAELVEFGLSPCEEKFVAAHFRPGARVLDVGCGGGREAFPLAAAGFDVTAVDYTAEFVAACRAGAAARALTVAVQQADVLSLPFADESFDHVMMVGQLLGHVRPRENRLRALREIRRVMRPGAAIVSTNAVERRPAYAAFFFAAHLARRFHNPDALEPYDAYVRRVGGKLPRGESRPIFHWYRSVDFRRDAAEAGWRVVEMARRWEHEPPPPEASTHGETFYVLRKE
jgi:SAM-dependent methyltransferase